MGKTLRFDVLGDAALTCRMSIIKKGNKRLPEFKIKVDNKDDQQQIESVKATKDGPEYTIHGNQAVTISW
jgi:hypothetical protein